MSDPIVCTPKALPRDQWVEAARKAVEINPANQPPTAVMARGLGGPGSQLERIAVMIAKLWHTNDLDPLSSTAWQVIFAGVSNLIFAIGNRDLARVVWTPRGVGAMLYLVVGGSWIGYTSYIWLLRHAPSSKVSTYAYVNPVVAVFLGWLVLHEAIDRYILMGSAIIIASVIMVTSAKTSAKPVAEEMPAVEAAGD